MFSIVRKCVYSYSFNRVTYRRLEKIASYHYLPRVQVNHHGSLRKSQSHQNVQNHQNVRKRSISSAASSSEKSQFLPLHEFGSLDSLTSVTTFSYIACRDQREREEDIYEVQIRSKLNIQSPRCVCYMTVCRSYETKFF